MSTTGETDRGEIRDEDGDQIDFESRALCPDGSCIGVLDDSGVCKQCGRRGELPPAAVGAAVTAGTAAAGAAGAGGGGPVRGGSAQPSAAGGRELVGGVGREDSDERDEEDDAGAELFADEDRRLCPDGACIGLIGYDGRCKVCGRSADDVGPE